MLLNSTIGHPTKMGAEYGIVQRFTPCGCGCKGQDSWHLATLHRAVRDILGPPTTKGTRP